MGGAAHGFIQPLPRLAAETTTTAANAGGPAGSPPRLCAHQQAHATARNNDDKNEDNRVRRATKAPAAGDTRATRCAGGQRPAASDTIIDDRWTAGDDKESSGQTQTTTNHCTLKAG